MQNNNPNKKKKKEANTCMALGAGVGILGATSAAITGAICPLCIVIAPALVGVGAFKRWEVSKNVSNLDDKSQSSKK